MKMCKKFLGMMLAAVMVFSLSMSAFAADPIADSTTDSIIPVASSELIVSRDENGNVQFEVTNNGVKSRISGLENIVGVYVYDVDRDHVKVSIQNLGLNTIDSVSMSIDITDKQGSRYMKDFTEKSIKRRLPRNNMFYVERWNRIVISNIVVRDEGDVGYLIDIDHWK